MFAVELVQLLQTTETAPLFGNKFFCHVKLVLDLSLFLSCPHVVLQAAFKSPPDSESSGPICRFPLAFY